MTVSVGDTFVIDDVRWSVKLIDLTGTGPGNKTNKPRIDASRFYKDEFGEEKVRKGRPSKFTVEQVCGAMGVALPNGFNAPPGFAPKTVPQDEVEEDWEEIRAQRESIISMIEDTSVDADWR